MYKCIFVCWRHGDAGNVKRTVSRHRHPLAFPAPEACPECGKEMRLGSFVFAGDPIVRRRKRTVVRRWTTRGSVELFPDFQG